MACLANQTSRSRLIRKRGWDFLRPSGIFCGRCSRAASGCKETPSGCWRSNAVFHHEFHWTAEQGIAEEEALKEGMEEMSKEFTEKGSALTRKPKVTAPMVRPV